MSKDTNKKLLAAIVAVNTLALELLGGTAAAPAAETPETPETPEGPTLAELREKAQALLADGKAADIKKVLAKFKAESLTKLDAKHYAAVGEALDGLAVG